MEVIEIENIVYDAKTKQMILKAKDRDIELKPTNTGMEYRLQTISQVVNDGKDEAFIKYVYDNV